MTTPVARVAAALTDEPQCVADLLAATGADRTTLWRALQVLRDAGLARHHKDGTRWGSWALAVSSAEAVTRGGELHTSRHRGRAEVLAVFAGGTTLTADEVCQSLDAVGVPERVAIRNQISALFRRGALVRTGDGYRLAADAPMVKARGARGGLLALLPDGCAFTLGEALAIAGPSANPAITSQKRALSVRSMLDRLVLRGSLVREETGIYRKPVVGDGSTKGETPASR